MVNLFAFRATEPSDMFAGIDPVGPGNDEWLMKFSKDAGVVVAARGNDGTHLDRSKEAVRLIPKLHYLKLNMTGEPAHPLYLKADLQPTR